MADNGNELPFSGFDEPTQNWSKLPHALVAALPLIETGAELKVILYILRHTWGFRDDEKRITLDEFESGRRRADGTRFDEGTGLSRPSIIDGLRRAEAHGFINVEVDDSDAGRIRKIYSIRMRNVPAVVNESDPAEVKELDRGGQETLPRTEKETPIENIPVPTEQAMGSPTPAQLLFGALAEVCEINLDTITERQRGELNQSVARLRRAGVMAADLASFREWWRQHDWRGKKGDVPRPTQVREMWGQYQNWRSTRDGSDYFATGLGPPATAGAD